MYVRVATLYNYNRPNYYNAPNYLPILYNNFNIIRVIRIYNLLVFLKPLAIFHVAYVASFALVAATSTTFAIAKRFVAPSPSSLLLPPLR